MLLLGWVDSSGNHRFFKRGSKEERAARYAVSHLLRHPDAQRPSWWIRRRLADLFDPSHVFAREISFGFRREGRPGARIKHRRIALAMLRMVRDGRTVKEAVEAAIAEYKLSDEREVRTIWARYGKPRLDD
jgi:hypothetical protein